MNIFFCGKCHKQLMPQATHCHACGNIFVKRFTEKEVMNAHKKNKNEKNEPRYFPYTKIRICDFVLPDGTMCKKRATGSHSIKEGGKYYCDEHFWET